MSIGISPVTINNYKKFVSLNNFQVTNVPFKGSNNNAEVSDGNPISRKGETINLVKATFLGGMALGARLLWELADGDFLFEHAGNAATKIVDKNRQGISGVKRDLCRAGAAVGIMVAGISAFALLYTMLNTPKIAYNSKVNAFKKGKEMDVYISANEAEKNIYTQLSEKAVDADDEERDKLKEQYMQMKMAKNQVPDYVKIK